MGGRWVLAVLLGVGLCVSQAWGETAGDIRYLVTAPQVDVTSGSLAQNETPLWVDLDRDAPNLQLSAVVRPGDVIRGSVVLGGSRPYRGYSVQILVDPPEAIPAVENIAFSKPSALSVYKEHLLKLGAPHVHLAGSGPALFVLLEEKAQASDLLVRCQNQRMRGHVVWLV